MWYEILPSAALVYVFITAPQYLHWGINKLFHNGKANARHWDTYPHDWTLYLRDRNITGSEYIPRGLESLPEED